MDGQPPPDFPRPPAVQPPVAPTWASPQPLPPPPPPLGGTRGDRSFTLRPMGVGEILDAAIKLYRSQWKRLMAIVAIALVPLTFLQVFLTREIGAPFADPTTTSPAELDSSILVSLVLAAIQVLVVQPFLVAAVAKASADVYLGHTVVVGPTFRFAVSKIHSILWISILQVLAIVVPAILLGLLAAFVSTELAIVILIAMVIPAIVAYFRFIFGSIILVVEGRKGSKALRRSWRLVKGSFWKVFGAVLLAALLSGVVESILSVPGAIAFAAIGPAGWPFYAIGVSLAAIVTTPFTTLIAVLLYFDLRIRKEAFDLEVMAHEMSAQP
jgi:hypothetical protein